VNAARGYRIPAHRYGLAPSGWRAATAWELADGAYKRLFRQASGRASRTAWVERHAGGWRWRVTERNARGMLRPLAVGSSEAVKPLPMMCFGAADLAATTR
jgi:hypothetical protein